MQFAKDGFNVNKVSHVHWCITDCKSCISVCYTTFTAFLGLFGLHVALCYYTGINDYA